MAFPSVLQSVTFQKDDTNATTFEVGAGLSTLTNGNTLLVIFACDGSATITLTADGFAQLANVSEGSVSVRAGFLKIDGTEPSTFTVTTSSTQRAAAVIYEIQGAADPDVTPPTQSSNAGPSQNPDPTSHTPAGGAKDFLWVAAIGVDRDATIDGFPSNMITGSVQLNQNGGGANSCSIGSDTHQENATVFDPDTFALDKEAGFGAVILSIFPAVAGGAHPAGPLGHPTHGPFGGPI